MQHAGALREKVAAYFEIVEKNVKHIFMGVPCGSGVLPDQEWDRATNVLPS